MKQPREHRLFKSSTKQQSEPKRIKVELLNETQSIMTVTGKSIACAIINNPEYQRVIAKNATKYREDGDLKLFYILNYRILQRDEGEEHIYSTDHPHSYVLEFNVGVDEAKKFLEDGRIADCILRAVLICAYGHSYKPDSYKIKEWIIKGKALSEEKAITPRSTNNSDSDEEATPVITTK